MHFNNRQFVKSIDRMTQYNKKLHVSRDTAKYIIARLTLLNR